MNKKRHTLYAVAFFIAIFVLPSNSMAGSTVRVLVLQGVKSLAIEGASRREKGSLTLKRSLGNAEALVNGRAQKLPLFFSPRRGRGEFIYVNKRPYRGRLGIYADGGAGLFVVNELDIEDYLAGMINYEISSAWPEDAVKAQAVAARTYVLYRMERAPKGPYDIEGTPTGQVYKGASAEDEAATKAVKMCHGEVLFFHGKPALTVYHSNGGGRTDAAGDIWKGDEYYPYLRSVVSPYDKVSPRYRWDFAVPASILGRLLRAEGFSLGMPRSLQSKDITPGGRVKTMRLTDGRGKTIVIGGEELRRLLGYSIIRSALFTVRRERGLFIFTGRGSGHGVGMSQWGARGMAEAGYSYKKILRHYYPGTRLKKLF